MNTHIKKSESSTNPSFPYAGFNIKMATKNSISMPIQNVKFPIGKLVETDATKIEIRTKNIFILEVASAFNDSHPFKLYFAKLQFYFFNQFQTYIHIHYGVGRSSVP